MWANEAAGKQTLALAEEADPQHRVSPHQKPTLCSGTPASLSCHCRRTVRTWLSLWCWQQASAHTDVWFTLAWVFFFFSKTFKNCYYVNRQSLLDQLSSRFGLSRSVCALRNMEILAKSCFTPGHSGDLGIPSVLPPTISQGCLILHFVFSWDPVTSAWSEPLSLLMCLFSNFPSTGPTRCLAIAARLSTLGSS